MAKRMCTKEGCTAPHFARGLCSRHYSAWWRTQMSPDHGAKKQAEWRIKNPNRYRAHNIASKHSHLTIDEAELLVAQRPEWCEICDVECNTHYDHCHATMKHRGWLCFSCNNGLGSFKDDPVRILAAYEYLIRFQEDVVNATRMAA